MTDKFLRLDIADVKIPNDIIIDVPEKHRKKISSAFGTDDEALFFIIAVIKDGKYHLVDRYDVYVAAKAANCKNIRAFVLSDYNSTTAHLTLSMKHFPNPATVVRLMKPYVKEHGLEKTLDMFYLDVSFGRMYNVQLDSKTLDMLELLVRGACSVGVRSVVPVQLFEEIALYDGVQQKLLIDNMALLASTQKSKFRWPHREFLRKISGQQNSKPQQKEKKLTPEVREFTCSGCNTAHIVTQSHIGPKQETEGVILISGDDSSEPIFSIPQKYQKHLGVSKESPPTVISSKGLDVNSLPAKLNGKNFVIFVGNDS